MLWMEGSRPEIVLRLEPESRRVMYANSWATLYSWLCLACRVARLPLDGIAVGIVRCALGYRHLVLVLRVWEPQ